MSCICSARILKILGPVLALALLIITPMGPQQARAARDEVAATAAALRGGQSVLLSQGVTAIAPGLTLTSFRRLQPGGWVTGHVMDADLTTSSLSMDVVDGGTVSASNTTVEDFATGAEAVAAVNGDYFDMNASDAPIGTNISPGSGIRTLSPAGRQAFTVTGGRAAVQSLMSAATLTVAPGTPAARSVRITAVNSPGPVPDGIALFNGVWGTHPLSRLIPAGDSVRILTVVDDQVTAISTDTTSLGTPAPGSSVLIARGRAIPEVAQVTVGSTVQLTVRASADVDLAVGGSQRLLNEGQITTVDEVTAARTAIGVSRDGSAIKVITLDGRAGDGDGMTIQELAHFMADLGVWNAVNLDGGGSTTLLARPAGTPTLQLINRPSDGSQRLDANALVFRSTAGRTTPGDPARGVRVRPLLQPAAGIEVPAAHAVLPGLSRTVLATRLDADLALAPGGPTVTASGAAGRIEQITDRADGRHVVLRAGTPGVVRVEAVDGVHTDRTEVLVHGPVTGIEASTPLLALPDAQTSGTIGLTASDGDGHRVPIETRDVAVTVSGGATVRPTGPDQFTVIPTAGSEQANITFRAAGHEVTVPVTVGSRDVGLADFARPADWKVGTARATGSLGAATGPDGGPALALDFDFTTTTATRGMYAVPVSPLTIEGQPQSLSLWINGSGRGEWPRLQVTLGDGTSTNLDGPLIQWQGWRKVRFPVPAHTPYPLTLTAIRFLETRSSESYTDRLEIAGLTAQVPAEVDLPAEVWRSDPAVLVDGSVHDRALRIATVSDAQFVARNPDSELVRAGRRALSEAAATRPDLLVINGDLVDEASPADFALARKVITESVGDTPWVYVPGNHEVMGGPISNFVAAFGPTSTQRVIKQTMIVTLDSSSGTLHPGGSTGQLQLVERALAQVASDPAITGVVVFDHHPVDDPQPDKASQLIDRYEAQALADSLARFRRVTGKSVAQIHGHVGIFHGSARDGVTRVINGNAGKNPSGAPDRGGFTGWSLVGIDPTVGLVGVDPTVGPAGRSPVPVTDRTRWLAIETRARVDDLTLSVPASLAVRDRGTARATIIQDGDHRVPVSWPVTAQWSGALLTKPGDRGHGRAVVSLDPATGELRALRRGVATITVTVNGVSRSASITVR